MNYLISLPGLLIAIIFHELAHGYAAYKLGDPTAKNAGRLTLNPIKHIDPVGFLFMLVFKFGWAKAVPINPSYFKNRKRDMIIVSVAGVLTNFILAILFGFIIINFDISNDYLYQMFLIAMWYNLMLGIFNLLPFPPLDGSKIVASLLPTKLEYLFYKYERYFYFVLLLLIMTNTINKILVPLINISLNGIIRILY
ncbi:site-2 protease family protein [Soehngenia longivitae]|uniref:Site-2 protease family protein n=1 Tax=Soehngenia longivitae TaxID=2562294 RepID=A0A4Z0D575_9FIRM|nr:site-2 protease family protein [Soehngenia longivitae]TFZ39764.1 site-2 protease family protein [Soehngenia longivitae]